MTTVSSTSPSTNPFESEIDEFERTFKDSLEESQCIQLSPSRSIYKITVQHILDGIRNSDIVYNQNNRFVDKSRVFVAFDISVTEPIILGLRHEKYHILDGQHRIEYLKSHPQLSTSPIMVDVRIYDDETEFIRQLKIINDRRIMEIKVDADPVKMKYSEFVEHFLHNHHFTAHFRKNRPYVNPETLMNVIVSSDFFRSPQNSGRDVFNKIVEINNFIGQLDRSKWSIEGKVEELYAQKTRETRYYLAFDKEYHPIKELINLDRSTFDAKWNDFLTNKRKKKKFVFK